MGRLERTGQVQEHVLHDGAFVKVVRFQTVNQRAPLDSHAIPDGVHPPVGLSTRTGIELWTCRRSPGLQRLVHVH